MTVTNDLSRETLLRTERINNNGFSSNNQLSFIFLRHAVVVSQSSRYKYIRGGAVSFCSALRLRSVFVLC